ncbi:MAG: hypothetical protein R2911_15095 [Caldilineaceae bacterium]
MTSGRPRQCGRRPDHHAARRCHTPAAQSRRWTAIRHAGHRLERGQRTGAASPLAMPLLNTSASFSVDGVYTLRLTADDGADRHR